MDSYVLLNEVKNKITGTIEVLVVTGNPDKKVLIGWRAAAATYVPTIAATTAGVLAVEAAKAMVDTNQEENTASDVSDNATSRNQMQKQVERGQAPDEVDRVDSKHDDYGQDYVHFKDGTSINKDGTIHDKHKGVPKLSRKVLDWLNKNGWCMNGLKN